MTNDLLGHGQKKEIPAHGGRGIKADVLLAVLPTVTVLIVFAVVEAWNRQRLLFASLASSAFLIYLDPEHQTNSTRTLLIAQPVAALVGFTAHTLWGASYWAAGGAMVASIALMIFLRAMHPPAVSTALTFAFGAGKGKGLVLFLLCIGLVVLLVGLQRASVFILRRVVRYGSPSAGTA